MNKQRQLNPNKKYKELKQKQKARIADFMYEETQKFYEQFGYMPYSKEDSDTVAEKVYSRVTGLGVWIPYDEVYTEYRKKRQWADWLVGINATRLFSVLYHRTLNVGRMVSPTLALLVQREAEIDAFKPESFYTAELNFGSFTATSEKFKKKADAKAVISHDGTAVVKSVVSKEKSEKAPALYDLTTLQREANRQHGYTAQQTLDYVQSLYEKKLCTYPRTDSRYLTDDMASGVGSIVSISVVICGLSAPSVVQSKVRIVWRCVSRLDYGTKYCKESPTMDEEPLQQAIMDAINSTMAPKAEVSQRITEAMTEEVICLTNGGMTLGEIQRRREELDAEFVTLLAQTNENGTAPYMERFREIAEETATLKAQQEQIAGQLRKNTAAQEKLHVVHSALEAADHRLTRWDEEMIRQLVHTVKVISKDCIRVYLTDGTEIEQAVAEK